MTMWIGLKRRYTRSMKNFNSDVTRTHFTLEEVGRFLRLNRDEINQHIERGTLVFERFGRKRKVSVSALACFASVLRLRQARRVTIARS